MLQDEQDIHDNDINDKNQKIFITNYSLIKKFIDNGDKNIHVYFIPNEMNQNLNLFFRKLDYIIKLMNDKEISLKMEYFNDLIEKFKLKKLEINSKFLKIRSDFLQMTNNEHYMHIFKDPINKQIIFPAMDIMVLNYDNMDELKNHKFEINTLNFKFLEGNFIQNYKKNLNKSNIILINYLNSEELYMKLKENLSQDDLKFNFLQSLSSLFVDKELSINFGRIERYGELVLAKYNFMRSCPGSIIYDMNFFPLGIATTLQNNLSVDNIISFTEIEMPKNNNVFLPFSNTGIIYIFKKFMGIEVDVNNFFRKNLFQVEKNVFGISNENKNIIENIFIDKDLSDVDEDENIYNKKESKIKRILKLKKDAKQFVLNNNENVSDSKLKSNQIKKYHRNKNNKFVDYDKKEIERMRKSFTEKMENQSFSYAPFNKLINEKISNKKAFAAYIDHTIDNLFKERSNEEESIDRRRKTNKLKY
jgi:hypothetical protein